MAAQVNIYKSYIKYFRTVHSPIQSKNIEVPNLKYEQFICHRWTEQMSIAVELYRPACIRETPLRIFCDLPQSLLAIAW